MIDRHLVGAKRLLPLALVLLALVMSGVAPAVAAPAGCSPAELHAVPPPQEAGQPRNLAAVYHDLLVYRCTRYDADIARVDRAALAWIEQRAKQVANPALVLDIDETALSNWAAIYHNSFAYFPGGSCDLASDQACGQAAWERSEAAPAIAPTLALFNAVKAYGVAVFFVTGRRDSGDERAITAANLERAGYRGWAGLVLRPVESHGASVAPFKARSRAQIAAQGYTIIADVGDQRSDLAGGHAERVFKLPNPFYYIP